MAARSEDTGGAREGWTGLWMPSAPDGPLQGHRLHWPQKAMGFFLPSHCGEALSLGSGVDPEALRQHCDAELPELDPHIAVSVRCFEIP